jgi:hypothetical protein
MICDLAGQRCFINKIAQIFLAKITSGSDAYQPFQNQQQ